MTCQAIVPLKRRSSSEQPLDSSRGLKYLRIIWFVIGTNPPHDNQNILWRILYIIYAAVINFLCAICFSASMFINLYLVNSFENLVANLSLNVSISMSIIKQLAVLKQRQLLLKSQEFLKLLDERSNQNSQERNNILKAIRYARLFALYLPVYVFCGCGFGYNGWTNHQLIYTAWYPSVFSSAEDNFLAAFIAQFISQIYIGFQSVFSDISPLCYLSLMIGHLESLAIRIARIGWDEKHSLEENIEELKNCITDHKNLLSYFDCVRPFISSTLFLQFLITGLALCLTAINLTFFSHDFNHQFFTLIYLIILLIQVFPCCWHVNVLMEKSDYLTTAMYSCNWVDQNKEFRKMLIIFMQRSQKTNTILAGNLAPVTLQTFLAIIRFSFSMFTILSKA